MRLGSRSTVLAATAAAFLILPPKAADPAALAPEVDVDLTYAVYFAGIHVAGLDVGIGLQPDAYDMKMQAKTVGLIGRLFPWLMNAYSRGSVAGSDITPLEAGQRGKWRGKDRFIDLQYNGKDVMVARAEPKPGEDDRLAVPEGMRRDTIDLASAILRIALSMEQGAKCSHSIPIFDGRRRYDMVLTHKMVETVKADRNSAFKGTAENCMVKMKRIAGFKRWSEDYDDDVGAEGQVQERRSRMRKWRDSDRSASVWIGKVFTDTPPLPVRLELQTPYGSIKAHLRHAELGKDGAKRRVVSRR